MNAPLLSPSDLLDDNRQRITDLGAIAAVWAHPDDETYVAGGLMSLARHLDQPVTCVTVTDGNLAPTEPERRAMAGVRRTELDLALDLLGVDDRVRFGWPDGGCAAIDDAIAVAAIADVLADRRPDTIVTFGPDGLTGHADHRAVARWVAAAARLAAPSARVLCPTITPPMWLDDRDVNERFDVYEPGSPTFHGVDDLFVHLHVDGPWLDRKLAALRAHASQTDGLIGALGVARYRRWISREPFIELSRW